MKMLVRILAVVLIAALLTPVALTEGEAPVQDDLPESAPAAETASSEAPDAVPEDAPEDAIDDISDVAVSEPVDAIVAEESVDLEDPAPDIAEIELPLDEPSDASEVACDPAGAGDLLFAPSSYPIFLGTSAIPSDGFVNYIRDNIDLDKNGWLTEEKAMKVTDIVFPHHYSETLGREVCDLNITTLAGIELFPELAILDCNGNLLDSLDLSSNPKLQSLSCEDNALVTLNVADNPSLQHLYCSGNALTALNLSGNPALQSLSCGDNKLNALDLGGNAELMHLSCYENALSGLNLANCKKLESLTCFGNQLTALDVSNNTNLEYLSCTHNNIAKLDISDLPRIAPYVSEAYKRDEDATGVYYCQTVEVDEYGAETWSGGRLYCDKATEVITAKPAPEPATPAATTPAPDPLPTIPAYKKVNKATVTAVSGTVYQLDLGGKTGRKYRSSNKGVAMVYNDGRVIVNGQGKTKITFRVGKKKRTLTLRVVDPTLPARVTLTAPTTAVKKGDTLTLTATVPEGANAGGFRWKSSNKKVARVKNGVVTFRKKGKVTITVTTVRGRKKARLKFRVSP